MDFNDDEAFPLHYGSLSRSYAIKRIYCVAHLINNVVTNGLVDLDPLIEKVS